MNGARARERPPIVCLMGPTGIGKTAIAVELAARAPFDIVSVDSAMVYRGMDIGTAKPGPEILARAPHRLIDICDPGESYSAARFRNDAEAAIDEILAAGRVPLLVGGTGLYFRALNRGLSPLPAAEPGLRARLMEQARTQGAAAMHARLAQVDPDAARRIHPNDPQRILRALEVHALTGTALSDLQSRSRPQPARYRAVSVALHPSDRPALHAALGRRFRAMVGAGLLEEVRALQARGDLDENLPAMRAVGYRQAWDHLLGRCDLPTMVERATAATRQLAKRQLTWLRGEADCAHIEAGAALPIDAVRAYLRTAGVI
ncbi:MAG: tRNA (adenosine(37)-N6)-dimethylallyltransferase MiaA [Gammaproteobacteria bacterium]